MAYGRPADDGYDFGQSRPDLGQSRPDLNQFHREAEQGRQSIYNEYTTNLWIAIAVTVVVAVILVLCFCYHCPGCIWASRRRNGQIGYGGQVVIVGGVPTVPQQPTYGQWQQQGGAYQVPGGYGYGQQPVPAYGQQPVPAYGQQPAPAYGEQQAPGYESAPSGSGPQVEQAPQTA